MAGNSGGNKFRFNGSTAAMMDLAMGSMDDGGNDRFSNKQQQMSMRQEMMR